MYCCRRSEDVLLSPKAYLCLLPKTTSLTKYSFFPYKPCQGILRHFIHFVQKSYFHHPNMIIIILSVTISKVWTEIQRTSHISTQPCPNGIAAILQTVALVILGFVFFLGFAFPFSRFKILDFNKNNPLCLITTTTTSTHNFGMAFSHALPPTLFILVMSRQ